MRKTAILLAALCLLAGGARAQEAWTLRRCIDHAISHNLSVRSGELSVAQSEMDLSTARSSRLPAVSTGASQNFSFGRGLTADNTYSNSNTTSTSFNLGADVPVFQGFRIKHNIALSKLDLAAATAELAKAKDDIKVAVAQAYIQVLFDKELLEVARGQSRIDSMHVARMEELLLRGRTSAADLAAQKASAAQSRYQETQAATNLKLALLDLSQLLELDSPEGFDIAPMSEEEAGQLALRLVESPEEVYADAVGLRPAIEVQERRLDAAGTRISLAKSQKLPSLSLSGGIGTNYYTSSNYSSASFTEQMKNNFSQFVGLSLSVPVFSRFSTRNSIRSAELQYRSQEIALESARKSLFKEIQQAWYSAVNAQERLRSSEQMLSSTREAFELSQAKYENGKANVTEFNEARNNLVKAESELVQARWQALYQRALVDFYRSGEIEF